MLMSLVSLYFPNSAKYILNVVDSALKNNGFSIKRSLLTIILSIEIEIYLWYSHKESAASDDTALILKPI